jgi:hypothetical protein
VPSNLLEKVFLLPLCEKKELKLAKAVSLSKGKFIFFEISRVYEIINF